VRHGERLDHVDRGWAAGAAHPHDTPLSARGRQQAAEFGAWWARKLTSKKARQFAVACVVSSPMRRCLETAAPIAAAVGAPLYVHHALHDISSRKMYPHGAPRLHCPAAADGSGVEFEGEVVPFWPFGLDGDGAHAAGAAVAHPETDVAFARRVRGLVSHVVGELLSALPAAAAGDCGRLRFTPAELSTARAPAHAARGALPSAKVMLVAHGDVVESLVGQLCPRGPAATGNGINVPYCSWSEVERPRSALSSAARAASHRQRAAGADENGAWGVVEYGNVAPISDSVVRVVFAKR
jgi:broad specificity phosphatase PhoE